MWYFKSFKKSKICTWSCVTVYRCMASFQSLVNLLSRKQQNKAACGILTKLWQLNIACSTTMQRCTQSCLNMFVQSSVFNCSCRWPEVLYKRQSILDLLQWIIFCIPVIYIVISVTPRLRWGLVALDSDIILFGLKPFSVEVKLNINVETELCSCFSRLCLILTLPPFPLSVSLFFWYGLVDSNVIINAGCWLLLIMRTSHRMDIWEHLYRDRTFPKIRGNWERVWWLATPYLFVAALRLPQARHICTCLNISKSNHGKKKGAENSKKTP